MGQETTTRLEGLAQLQAELPIASGFRRGVFTQVVYYLSEVNFRADPNALYVLFAGGNDLARCGQT